MLLAAFQARAYGRLRLQSLQCGVTFSVEYMASIPGDPKAGKSRVAAGGDTEEARGGGIRIQRALRRCDEERQTPAEVKQALP